ncbi:MAG: anti-sigma factor [Proteobacteria bacterium]|nr:anti-sigma factor [Pseudomonadota bacterium]MBS0572485.1 anti-sigma factor [Pseudomonadota bacterium]
MTDPSDMSDREGLAAEYVLGTLPLAERLQAERLIASDPDFARLVQDWTDRLAPLNDGYGELPPPPGLLPRIEARLFPRARQGRWRLPLIGALASGLAALLLVAYWPATTPGLVTARLTGQGQALVVAASYDPARRSVTFTRAEGPAAEAGKDYELWVIPAGQKPLSLGLLRDEARTVTLASLPAGTTLAVTLEQAGGSPTGAPQGPILAATTIGS